MNKTITVIYKIIKELRKSGMNTNVMILSVVMAGVVGLGFGSPPEWVWMPLMFILVFLVFYFLYLDLK